MPTLLQIAVRDKDTVEVNRLLAIQSPCERDQGYGHLLVNPRRDNLLLELLDDYFDDHQEARHTIIERLMECGGRDALELMCGSNPITGKNAFHVAAESGCYEVLGIFGVKLLSSVPVYLGAMDHPLTVCDRAGRVPIIYLLERLGDFESMVLDDLERLCTTIQMLHSAFSARPDILISINQKANEVWDQIDRQVAEEVEYNPEDIVPGLIVLANAYRREHEGHEQHDKAFLDEVVEAPLGTAAAGAPPVSGVTELAQQVRDKYRPTRSTSEEQSPSSKRPRVDPDPSSSAVLWLFGQPAPQVTSASGGSIAQVGIGKTSS
jgi:hypothetical protein